MTKTTLPGWKEKQKLLNPRDQKVNRGFLSELAKRAFEAGAVQEAFEYYRAAQDQKGLDDLKYVALDEGDVFILSSLEKISPAPFDHDIWNKIGYRAFELGKYRFARTAFERTSNELMLAKISATEGEAGGHASQPV
jgi:hypothetical protein